jgi:cytochrome c oxidase subunit III
MSSTIYQPMRTPPALGATPVRVAKELSVNGGASQSGIWVGIFAITMSFAAFTSALFVREGAAVDWKHIAVPPILYANTIALLVSSITLHKSWRSLAIGTGVNIDAARLGLGWMMATLVLGGAFIGGQYEAWHQLAHQGLYLATNPNSSFYYVLTAMHGLHLLAGIVALLFVISRLAFRPAALRRSTLEATATYWHFMGVLWLYLLVVLRTKL